MTGLFAYYTRKGGSLYFPGAPYLTGGFLLFCSAVIAWLSLRNRKVPENEVPAPENAII
jgi:hypothetical protein